MHLNEPFFFYVFLQECITVYHCFRTNCEAKLFLESAGELRINILRRRKGYEPQVVQFKACTKPKQRTQLWSKTQSESTYIVH